MTIGTRIKALRKEMNFTQEYVAEKLNVSRQAVSKWEKDISNPDTYNLISLAELLNSSVEYIAAGKKETGNASEKKLSKKKIIKICITIVVSMTLSAALYIHSRPVKWDILACGGGYTTWIFDKYESELINKFLNGMGEEKKDVLSIEAIRGTQDAKWEKKQIFLEFCVRYTHKTKGETVEKIRFIGTRYWIDSFKWSGAIIVG